MKSDRVRFLIARCAAALGLAFFLAPPLALAGPLWFKFDSVAAYDVVSISYGSFSGQVYAGQNIGELSSTSDFTGATPYYTFCVDLDHEVRSGQMFEVVPASLTDLTLGRPNGAAIAYLYANYGTSAINDNDTAAALQLAFWDLVANSGAQPTVGSPLQYTVSPSLASQVQVFLDIANAHRATGLWANPMGPGITNPPPAQLGQGFLIQTDTPSVPEPSTAVLAATGAGVLFLLARRLRRGTR